MWYLWSDGRVARQRSAKPRTAVRIRFRPHGGCPIGLDTRTFFYREFANKFLREEGLLRDGWRERGALYNEGYACAEALDIAK